MVTITHAACKRILFHLDDERTMPRILLLRATFISTKSSNHDGMAMLLPYLLPNELSQPWTPTTYFDYYKNVGIHKQGTNVNDLL